MKQNTNIHKNEQLRWTLSALWWNAIKSFAIWIRCLTVDFIASHWSHVSWIRSTIPELIASESLRSFDVNLSTSNSPSRRCKFTNTHQTTQIYEKMCFSATNHPVWIFKTFPSKKWTISRHRVMSAKCSYSQNCSCALEVHLSVWTCLLLQMRMLFQTSSVIHTC